MARYSDVEVRRDRITNALHIRYLGGQLDGVEVVVTEDELRRDPWGQFQPVNVDALASAILLPASQVVLEGYAVEVVQPRLALPPAPPT